jgi:hypothetical protein
VRLRARCLGRGTRRAVVIAAAGLAVLSSCAKRGGSSDSARPDAADDRDGQSWEVSALPDEREDFSPPDAASDRDGQSWEVSATETLATHCGAVTAGSASPCSAAPAPGCPEGTTELNEIPYLGGECVICHAAFTFDVGCNGLVLGVQANGNFLLATQSARCVKEAAQRYCFPSLRGRAVKWCWGSCTD